MYRNNPNFKMVSTILCTVLAVYLILAPNRGECYVLPRNSVVMAGSDKILQCAEDDTSPFRWYIYPPSNIIDKVIFTGVMMAYDVDQQYRIYTKPDNFPFQQLDLLISDVEVRHFGTYKCEKVRGNYCAEIIVMSSVPRCDIYYSPMTVQLKCEINMTMNGRPEMKCTYSLLQITTLAACTERDGYITQCKAYVPTFIAGSYTCIISVKHRPMRNYSSCSHDPGDPDYRFVWPTYLYDSKYSGYGVLCILAASFFVFVFVFVVFVVGFHAKAIQRLVFKNYRVRPGVEKSGSIP